MVDKKFDRIRNLNDNTMNEAFADILCEKDGLKYIISVKARNKYQKDGKLNSRYNLGSKVYEKALSAEKNTMHLPIGWQYNSTISHSQYILAL